MLVALDDSCLVVDTPISADPSQSRFVVAPTWSHLSRKLCWLSWVFILVVRVLRYWSPAQWAGIGPAGNYWVQAAGRRSLQLQLTQCHRMNSNWPADWRRRRLALSSAAAWVGGRRTSTSTAARGRMGGAAGRVPI